MPYFWLQTLEWMTILTDRLAVVLAALGGLLFVLTNSGDPGRVYAALMIAAGIAAFVFGRAFRWIFFGANRH